MGIPIKLQVPFHVSMEVLDYECIVANLGKSVVDTNLKTKGGLSGFHMSFLLETLDALAKEDNWKVFNVVLACSIYGIVLFPNVVDFIYMNVICIFMMRDVYHYIHSINHKRRNGLVWCCAPLLYHWYRSHLPCK